MAAGHTIGHVTQFDKISESEHNVHGDLIMSNGKTIRIRLTPDQIKDIERMEREGIVKPAAKDNIIPDKHYTFESISDLLRQCLGAVHEFYFDEPLSPPKQNAPTGNVKIHLKIEDS